MPVFRLAEEATIICLRVIDADMAGGHSVGALAGTIGEDSLIGNIDGTRVVRGHNGVGGLLGFIDPHN